MYPYELIEDLIVRLELNSSEKVILCTGDTAATYKLSDISLEYDAIFDEPYFIGKKSVGKKISSAKNFVGNKYSSPRQKFVTFYRRNFLPGYI